MGTALREAVQDEDCHTLSVSTPRADGGQRPVMVWLHGGAYVVGSGSSDWYRPGALIREGDVVVVRVNYRLGVFGYLKMPGVSPANLAVMDQIAALRWVQRNIAAFGGDPAASRSSVSPRGPLGGDPHVDGGDARPLPARHSAERSSRGGIHGAGDRGARGAPVRGRARGSQSAQRLGARAPDGAAAVIVRMSRPAGMNSTPVFGPIAGEPPIPEASELTDSPSHFHAGTDLVIGTTRDEMRAFFDSNPLLDRVRGVPGVGRRALAALTVGVTRRVFGAPAERLADSQARAGAGVYRYRFDWTPPSGGFGACHTIDLPFVFGDREAWGAAPMLGATPWEAIDVLGKDMRRAWTSFARHGDPSLDGGRLAEASSGRRRGSRVRRSASPAPSRQAMGAIILPALSNDAPLVTLEGYELHDIGRAAPPCKRRASPRPQRRRDPPQHGLSLGRQRLLRLDVLPEREAPVGAREPLRARWTTVRPRSSRPSRAASAASAGTRTAASRP